MAARFAAVAVAVVAVAVGCVGPPPRAAAPEPRAAARRPFGDVAPVAGVLRPRRAGVVATAAAAYDAWAAAYLAPGCADGELRVRTVGDTDAYAVSEAHGYAMVLTALLAGHDPRARARFDGLVAYYRAHPSESSPARMAWAQDEACRDVDGPASATDGDLDIAYALLLADAQWGSTGAVDYRALADALLAAILAGDVGPADTLVVGDWARDPRAGHADGTRPSDLAVGHLRAFAAVTGEPRWTRVADRAYATIAALQRDHAAATGLLPDFAVAADTAAPAPAPAGWLEGAGDGAYGYNACRTPWRIATDAIVAGEPRARAAVAPITAWFRATTGGDPRRVVDGYALDGTPRGDAPSLAFVAPLAVAATLDVDHPAWLDALWDHLVAAPSEGYYGDTLRVLAMVVVAGQWWAPGATGRTP